MRSMTLGTKMIVIMVCMLSLFTLATTTYLYQRSNADLARIHNRLRQNHLDQFELIRDLQTQRLIVWIEAFALQAMNGNRTHERLFEEIQANYDMLRIHWQVENIWLIDQTGNILEPSGQTLPQSMSSVMAETRSAIRPIDVTQCQPDCRHIVSVPILIDPNNSAVIIVSTSMQELISVFSESTRSRAAIITMVEGTAGDGSQQREFELKTSLTMTAAFYVNSALQASANVPMNELQLNGAIAAFNEQFISQTFLPLEQPNSNGYYLIALSDVSDIIAQNSQYQRSIVAVALAVFLFFTSITYFMLARFRDRLLNITHRLPLLAQRKFTEFKQRKLSSRKLHLLGLNDEVDVLEKAAEKLSEQLETLDQQNRFNVNKLEKMAMYDPLTEMPNRNMLTFQIEKQLSVSQRNNQLVALVFLDLDDFKKVNDAFGHEVGDRLLQSAGHRIAQSLRDADLAARFGGDEFVILLTEIESLAQVETVANKLIRAFTQPVIVDDKPFYISISGGIAHTKNAELSSVELLKNADIAMYEAKGIKGSAYRIFDSTMNKKVIRRVDLEAAARSAMMDDQFSLALQPLLDLPTRTLVGFEALLRWHHPEKGVVPPGEFIPILENTAFMLNLDYWVIARACRLLKELQENGLSMVKLCINLSASQFMDPSLPTYMADQISKHDVMAQNLELELTETALVSDMGATVEVIQKIRALGCKIAIDDFGTGYASLSYLKNIPADAVKLDQSFVAGMMDNRSDRNIVFATISMVTGLGMTVIGEGIELPSQYELLCHFGCHQGQGYLFSRPIHEDRIWDEIKMRVTDGIWQVDLPALGEDETQIPLL